MAIVFITGSGTGVGKTYVASLLLRELRQSGRNILAFKPIATGMVPIDDPAFAETDTARLLAAQGIAVDAASVAACTPCALRAPYHPTWRRQPKADRCISSRFSNGPIRRCGRRLARRSSSSKASAA